MNHIDLKEAVRRYILANLPYNRNNAALCAEMQAKDARGLLIVYHNWMSRRVLPVPREVKKSKAFAANLFRFLRYDVRLEESWLAQKLGKHLSADFISKLRPMDNPANMRTLYELGQSAAADQVKREDLMFARAGSQPTPQ